MHGTKATLLLVNLKMTNEQKFYDKNQKSHECLKFCNSVKIAVFSKILEIVILVL